MLPRRDAAFACAFILLHYENIVLACTNLSAVFSIYIYIQRALWLQAGAVTAAMVASFWYHLIECHKHSMPGIGVCTSRREHDVWINVDRVCAVLAVLACGSRASVAVLMTPLVCAYLWTLLPLALGSIYVSEQVSDRYGPELAPRIHVCSHGVWHVSVFMIALVSAVYF